MMVRDLEKKVLMITPDSIMMEGETVLTQYIILSWKLDYVNQSMLFYIYICIYNDRSKLNLFAQMGF